MTEVTKHHDAKRQEKNPKLCFNGYQLSRSQTFSIRTSHFMTLRWEGKIPTRNAVCGSGTEMVPSTSPRNAYQKQPPPQFQGTTSPVRSTPLSPIRAQRRQNSLPSLAILVLKNHCSLLALLKPTCILTWQMSKSTLCADFVSRKGRKNLS